MGVPPGRLMQVIMIRGLRGRYACSDAPPPWLAASHLGVKGSKAIGKSAKVVLTCKRNRRWCQLKLAESGGSGREDSDVSVRAVTDLASPAIASPLHLSGIALGAKAAIIARFEPLAWVEDRPSVFTLAAGCCSFPSMQPWAAAYAPIDVWYLCRSACQPRAVARSTARALWRPGFVRLAAVLCTAGQQRATA